MGMYLFGGISSFAYGMYLSVDQAERGCAAEQGDRRQGPRIHEHRHLRRQAIGVAITSSIVTILGSYNFVFPTAIAMAIIAAVAVLGIKRVK